VDLPQLREVVGVTSDDVDVKGYADLISDSKLRGDDPDVVGRELQDLGGDTDYLVAWLPGWLVEEKDVELVGRSDNVVSGQVDYETEKAYLVVVDDETEDAPRPVTDGGEDVCPTCGEDPEKSYRCQNCGADLVGKGTSSSSSRANLGDPQ